MRSERVGHNWATFTHGSYGFAPPPTSSSCISFNIFLGDYILMLGSIDQAFQAQHYWYFRPEITYCLTMSCVLHNVHQHPWPLTTRFQYPPVPFDDSKTLLQILPNVPWQGNHRACFPQPHKKNSLSSGEFMANSIWVDNVCDWHHQLCPPNYCFLFIKRSLIGRNMLKKNSQFSKQIGEEVVANVKQIGSTRWCF